MYIYCVYTHTQKTNMNKEFNMLEIICTFAQQYIMGHSIIYLIISLLNWK